MLPCEFCARTGQACSIAPGRRACVACRRGHRRCSLSDRMPRAPPNFGSRPRPRKRARPDPFVVSDDNTILEDPWTPPGSPSRRPLSSEGRDSASPFRRAGPPRKEDFSSVDDYRRAVRFWSDRVRMREGARDPRLDEILRRRAAAAPVPPPAPTPAPSAPAPQGTPPPPASPVVSDGRPTTPEVPPPPSPIVVPSSPPDGPSPPRDAPGTPSSPPRPLGSSPVPAPAPPSSNSPEIPEIPVVMALPAAGFEAFAERSTAMLRNFLATPGAQSSESRREFLASYRALLASSRADMEEMMRMA